MKHTLTLLLLWLPILAFAQAEKPSLAYYLPKDATYNPSIPTPAQVLGYEVGEWHVSHDQLVMYMRALDAASDRIAITEYGRTYENRPLLLLSVTSPANHARLEEIREQHLKLTDPSQSDAASTDNMPIVVWMGYSVHGNEPSGSNSSLLVAYHLAAAQGAAIDEMLSKTVILLDPSINPDGLNRFASWVNTHKSKNLVTDPSSREFGEAWPGGRTNHYWFDMNRDWLPSQLPESQGRLRQFHRWRPNILTDHHEMGTNSTFFFQPGVPSRKHPLTPDKNVELTGKIAQFHAKALDGIQSLYYSEENFDDFFYGKGSTYPDVQGAVGILFEQASSRGHAQESVNGVVRFPFTIKNQFTVSLSTLEAAQNMRKEMLDYQRSFYKDAMQQAVKDETKAYIFGESSDSVRQAHFVDLLMRHQIKVYPLQRPVDSQYTFAVPTEQPQYSLIKAIFETQTKFTDSLFYDISAWTLPYTFNIPYKKAKKGEFAMVSEPLSASPMPKGALVGRPQVGYAFSWTSFAAPKALYWLQSKGVKAQVSSQPLYLLSDGKEVALPYGSISIPKGMQTMGEEALHKLMMEAIQANGLLVYGVETGLTRSGIDLGSPSFSTLSKPEVAVLVGSGVSSYDAGEVWHLLDQHIDMPVTLLEKDKMNSADLSRYTAIVMAEGNYGDLNNAKLKAWLQEGGVLITFERATRWAVDNGLAKLKIRKMAAMDSTAYKPYSQHEDDLGSRVLGGSIFQGELDITHPIGYGYTRSQLPVFRANTLFYDKAANPYATPLRYTQSPLLSGYATAEHLRLAKGASSVTVHAYGGGRVICFAENPTFRGFWRGTNKLLLNAIFFGETISSASAR